MAEEDKKKNKQLYHDKMREINFPQEAIGEEYEYLSYIGSGSYGHVCKARQISTGRIVAIKKFSNIFKNNTNTLRLLRELRILRKLRSHPRIIELLEIIVPKNLSSFCDLYIVMEFMDTDLARVLDSSQQLTEMHVQYILYQILLATKCLHSAKIYHRDLKPQNILVNENCKVKICDFGLSRGEPIGEDSGHERKLTSHVVTRWYRAPEVILLTRRYTSAIDIWSIGCIFAEILSMQKGNYVSKEKRGPLFPGISCFPLSPKSENRYENSHFLDQMSVILHVIGTPNIVEKADFANCSANHFLENLPYWPGTDLKKKYPASSDLCIDLLKKMLQFSPSKRLSVEEALRHKYLEEVREASDEIKFPRVQFEFEDYSMKKHGRGLILREILQHNKKCKLLLSEEIRKPLSRLSEKEKNTKLEGKKEVKSRREREREEEKKKEKEKNVRDNRRRTSLEELSVV